MLGINIVVTASQGVFDVPYHGVDPCKQLISHRLMATSCHYCSMWMSSINYSSECAESITDNTAGMISEMSFRPVFQLLFPKTGDHTKAHIQWAALCVGLHGSHKGVFVGRTSSPFASMFFTTPVGIIQLHMSLQGAPVLLFFHDLHEIVLKAPRGVIRDACCLESSRADMPFLV